MKKNTKRTLTVIFLSLFLLVAAAAAYIILTTSTVLVVTYTDDTCFIGTTPDGTTTVLVYCKHAADKYSIGQSLYIRFNENHVTFEFNGQYPVGDGTSIAYVRVIDKTAGIFNNPVQYTIME